ncbi:MAG TPA: CehA/McbA family metallohydrolase [Fervidobacterium sp.]|nr:CehA/McbA family metallohydrolase [Fervidobacterium sp.]HPZ17854.1 CehA/McbA family metallohydrolase [Fervidobacterium sp.]HQE48876.1 CehA/McbA family metallohydrolase [Fervidobacterium sp.]HRD20016.1 CehA/McbA family metallohydrolase [Fervidobacterium sp.]HUM42708.1 CehA/McbA family metallohydrolase [Fervidobacterium sp.]
MNKKRFFFFMILLLGVLVIGQSTYQSDYNDYKIFFGNLHSHTSYSDGKGTPEQAFTHATDYGDFLAVTDHCYFMKIPIDGQQKTMLVQKAARASTVSGKFVGFQGFEWTAGSGHINVYESLEFISRDEKGDLKDFYEWIVEHKRLAQFNHPGVTFGNFQDFWFVPSADRYVNLIEIGNGNSSSNDTISEEMYNNYILALNRGWHVSPTANQDNHKENWISANESRTGILAKSLTYEDLMDALWNGRTFATEDRNAILYFYGNNAIMGSIINDATSINLYVRYQDSKDPVSSMTIVSQGGIVDQAYNLGDVFDYSKELTVPDGFEWYFVYIVQEDGDEIVSAPIWVETSEQLKVNYVRVGPEKPNINQSVLLVFDVYNSVDKTANSTLKVLLDDVEVYLEVFNLEPYEIVYSKELNLGKLASGVHNIKFVVNGEVVQSKKIEIAEKTGLTVLVDKLHENDFTPEVMQFINVLQSNGHEVVYSDIVLANYEGIDAIIIPTPKEDGLSFFKDLLPMEIDWLNSFQGKIYIIPGSDTEFLNIYKGQIENTIIIESLDELYEIFTLNSSVSNLKHEFKKIVYIDQGHGNDYGKNDLKKLQDALKNNGFETQYINKIENIDGKYLVIMNGKEFSDDELKTIATFVKNGGNLVLTSKSDYSNGGYTEDMNMILDYLNAPVRFNDDQVIDDVNNYGSNFKVLIQGLRFYSTCSIIVYGNADILVSSDTATTMDADNKNDSTPVDKVVLATKFNYGNGTVFVMGKAIFSDYDYDFNKEFIEKNIFNLY